MLHQHQIGIYEGWLISKVLSWLCHDKPEIHSGSTPSLRPRFGTFGLLVVPKLEGDLKGSTFVIGCRSWGGCAQMDQQQTRNFLDQRNGEMDRTSEEMYGHKWWLCWKISVQCGRELNFLHSYITVIILHGQMLILYNWRPYLSITPRSCVFNCCSMHIGLLNLGCFAQSRKAPLIFVMSFRQSIWM